MAVAKVILNGVTEIDLTNDSVAANKVLSGESFHLATGVSTVGTISTQAAQTITPGTTNQTIASGKYLTGTQTILGDANLIAGNIAAGVSIFGVIGTHQGGGTYQSKTVSATESVQTVIPDDGYDALSSVTVNAISSTYIGSGVTQCSSSDLSVSGAVVTVPSGYYGADASISFSIYDGGVT